MSPGVFVCGFGNVRTVSCATVIATMSSLSKILYVVVDTSVLVLVGAKDKFPEESDFKTESSVGVDDGKV